MVRYACGQHFDIQYLGHWSDEAALLLYRKIQYKYVRGKHSLDLQE